MTTKQCPYCAETIQQTALKCRYCHEWLTNSKTPSVNKEEEANPIEIKEIKEVIADQKVVEPTTPPVPLVEEEPTPPVAPPIASFAASKPVEEAYKPRLIKQNYKLAKIMALAIPFLILFTAIAWSSAPKNDTLAVFIVILFCTTIGLTMWLFSMLNKHLLNFDLYNNIRGNITCLIYCLPAMPLIIFLSVYFADEAMAEQLYLIAMIILYAILVVTHGLVGWRLGRFEGDYVGGLSAFGYTLLAMMVVMPVLIPLVLPFLAYNIFRNAENYADIYGYHEETRD